MKTERIRPSLLELARESRELTQTELARRSNIEQYLLSRYENGLTMPSEEHLQTIAAVLDYPVAFFRREESILGFGTTCMYHRKRQSLRVRELRRIHAKINITRMNLERLLRSVEISAKHEIPRLDISEYGDPEYIAELVRMSWHLPLGPIRSMVATIERAGGIVVFFPFETDRLDAISQLMSDLTPVFFINARMPWERIRFSLAHEIGHLVMHRNPSLNQETEADEFASAFLMPKREIKSQLSPMSLERAASLKQHWKVSMQALIVRSFKLGQISKSQYSRIFTRLSKLGYRKNEPNPLSAETPSTLSALVNIHMRELKYSKKELGELLLLPDWELEALFLPAHQSPIREIKFG